MKYALNLGGDGRILSVTFEKYAPNGAVLVEELPEGNLYKYRYVDGEFVYDPMPEHEQAEGEVNPSLEERVNSLEADSADMKEALEMILNGVIE